MRRTSIATAALACSACTLLVRLGDFDSEANGAGPPDGSAALPDGESGGNVDGAIATEAGSSPHRYRDAVLADAPVLYLRFGEASGTVAVDEMSRSDGAYGGGVILGAEGAIPGDPDTAMRVDGDLDSFVTLPPGLDFAATATFSVEVWVMQSSPDEFPFVVDHQAHTPERYGWCLIHGADGASLERWRNDGASNYAVAGPLAPNAYHHLVGTFDGERMAFYADGRLVDENAAAPVRMPPMTAAWTIGRQTCECTNNKTVGSIDELAIYDKALTAGQVSTHFAASGR